ncbi:6-phosphogluconolactonase/glucosamine-6- phosphate isomerase/deaminase [Paramagnetospirillum caucaseum]|uniref:6-phosphogluconolactonase/glucosamine-6-phosphate isomerase/deaminase n=1 Tax=Paramagnetospirillum caucaseum TaxID=1244869 RepID=M2ZKH2_9PROT|nr:glucosamine-6-phosphate deaminase [Paramagnetospirillum caucaseum]EME67802.1 6-phosphogluconolactonase/glucosamine-6- phosphate isomerase/deaminase [Paramagnetospirillum caucaseum]
MRVLIEPDAPSVAARAASLVEGLVRNRPDCVIGLAAGATPLAMYAELTDRLRALDFSRATVFGLDEYLGLDADHPASCALTLGAHFIAKSGIHPSRVHLLDGTAQGDFAAYCAAYEESIRAAGGLDLQILGLGVNGHVGFNEPGCGLAGRTRLMGLRRSTRTTNALIFAPAEVPRAALTMGLGTILSARRIILLATGPAKADAVAGMVEGPVSALVPASALQLHPDAVVVLDEAAAAGLALAGDYRDEAAILMKLGGLAAI